MVVLAVFGLFRLSRIVLKFVMSRLQKKYGVLGQDRTLYVSFLFLLAGLLFLPSFTSLLAVFDRDHLVGGMPLHLSLVALSIILFSISEDMLREFPSIDPGSGAWSVSQHFRRLAIPFILFWAMGVVLLSPIFYSGLTVILALFYLYALSCRKKSKTGEADESS
jgi:hypothetical protein